MGLRASLLLAILAISMAAGCQAQENKPLILIYTPMAPNFGQKLQKLIEADGRMDADVEVLESPEMFNLMMHYPNVKASVVSLLTDVNHDIGLTLEWFFSKGGGLVGLGFAGSEHATGKAAENVFPIFANAYRTGVFDKDTRSFTLTHIKEQDDEISEGVSDFSISDNKILLSTDPATKEYLPRTPKTGQYKVLFRERDHGVPSIVKYKERGASVTFACFGGSDEERGYGYYGRFADSNEFKTLFTNALWWVWNNEAKFEGAMEHSAGYSQRLEESERLKEKATEEEKKAERTRLIQTILVMALAIIVILGIYWITFVRAPKG